MFAVVSGTYILFLFGLGYWIVQFLPLSDERSHACERAPLILVTGFLINHLILLLVQSLEKTLWIGFILLGCSVILFVVKQRRGFGWNRDEKKFPVATVVFVLSLYGTAILLDPLKDWDARSIWFFHSKMIWSAESINMSAGWNNPLLQFSHVDYPKLIPVLAAQLSYVLGYWNEYMPKFSLLLILIPAIFWVFSFNSRSLSFLCLVLVFPFGLKNHLLSGSMDGYVALYSAISMLLAGRYFKHRRLLDLMSGIGCLLLISNFKNEGILIALIGMFSILATGILAPSFSWIDLKKVFSWPLMGWLAMIASPCIIWSFFYKRQWGLMNDLQLGTAESLLRIMNRLSDGVSLQFILKKTLFHDESAVWLALTAFIVCMIFLVVSRRHMISWIPASVTAIVYYGCIIMIYLMTPKDLNWHLSTSVQRVMLTVSGCLIAGTYFVLDEFETASSTRKDQNCCHDPG